MVIIEKLLSEKIFKKFPDILRGKFLEISELTTLLVYYYIQRRRHRFWKWESSWPPCSKYTSVGPSTFMGAFLFRVALYTYIGPLTAIWSPFNTWTPLEVLSIVGLMHC